MGSNSLQKGLTITEQVKQGRIVFLSASGKNYAFYQYNHCDVTEGKYTPILACQTVSLYWQHYIYTVGVFCKKKKKKVLNVTNSVI